MRQSSDDLFWAHHDRKYMASVQNPSANPFMCIGLQVPVDHRSLKSALLRTSAQWNSDKKETFEKFQNIFKKSHLISNFHRKSKQKSH